MGRKGESRQEEVGACPLTTGLGSLGGLQGPEAHVCARYGEGLPSLLLAAWLLFRL